MSRILVVEDEPRIASLVAKGLRADGHDVVVAEDGQLGLFLADADDVDLVVLDLGLPGLPGGAVLNALGRRRGALPVVVLTGRDEPERRTACLSAGARAFLTKPFSTAALRTEVRAQLSARAGLR
jgi:DNA-binding response OmpR family regulator